MLRWRLLLGMLLVAVFAGLCWADFRQPGLWLAPISLVVALLAAGEMLWLFRSAGVPARPLLVYLGSLSIVGSGWTLLLFPSLGGGPAWPALKFTTWILILLTVEILAYRQAGGITVRVAATTWALVYCGLLWSYLPLLRLGAGDNARGIAALISLISIVKLNDVGAYTVGRLAGRHKLAPLLSPGKTIEGFCGGLAFAVAGAWFALAWLAPRITASSAGGALEVRPWQWITFGLVVGLAGTLGDLAESLLKRDLGRKDSSSWLPGFGGVLDIIDSMVFAAPVAYLLWEFLLAG